MADFSEEDVGNIILLEHVNVQIPDQALATLFYVVGLGLTRDPYLNVGLRNMWVNVGEQQFHLPTRPPQVINGHVGLVVSDLESLENRLASVEEGLRTTRFRWSRAGDRVDVTCPWGNQFRCFGSDSSVGDMGLGIAYVEFLIEPGASEAIANFYEKILGAPHDIETAPGGKCARIKIGQHQSLIFKETDAAIVPYDGHHIAIYVANFSRPYGSLKARHLISEEVRNHQFRFKDIIDLDTGRNVFTLEHEVRSLRHPMFHRPFVNRNVDQSQAAYRRGRDSFIPFRA
jgi:hypothetical protein